MLEDDDLNAYILSKEKELINKHLSRIVEINEKIRESHKDLHNLDFNNKIQANDIVWIKNHEKN